MCVVGIILINSFNDADNNSNNDDEYCSFDLCCNFS